MSVTSTIQQVVRATDAAIARAYLRVFRERNALMSFLFHSLFKSEQEIALNHVDPLQRTTVAEFRQFIEYYLKAGYQFISPTDLLNGIEGHRKYALITFDDGYYNNVLARPILEEFGIPAIFFISTNHVRDNKCYWWDALYRERTIQGWSHAQVKREANQLKHLKTDVIEANLRELFGPDCLKPRSDIDRPFTPDELREFARCPYVHLGNHTADHAILTNYTADEVRDQVVGAQGALEEMTGKAPNSIAYPNGAHNSAIVSACDELGLKLGFTVRPEKVPVPLETQGQSLLRLGRFCLHGEDRVLTQCRTYRSDLQLYGTFRDSYLRFRRGEIAS